MDQHLQYAQLLFEQDRLADAEKEVKQSLQLDPENIDSLCLLSQIYLEENQFSKAEESADAALKIDPAWSYLYFLKSRISAGKDQYRQAISYIKQAIELSPYEASYFGFWSLLLIDLLEFEKALEKADQALALHPENLMALNARSRALVKLNRKDESFQTIEGALRESPDNTYTHANYGWGLLEKRQYKKAKEHFREAIKNDPTNEYAKAGMVEAIKSRNWIYRMFLNYSFFMAKQKKGMRWAIIIGIYLVLRFLSKGIESIDQLQPVAYVILPIFLFFIFGTWFMNSLSDFVLLFDKYGKALLDKKDKLAARITGALVTGIVIFLILGFAFKGNYLFPAAGVCFLMLIPVGSMFHETKPKNILIYFTIALGALGLLAITNTFLNITKLESIFIGFFIGIIAYTWIANIFISRASLA